tara:strand:- start:17602 stop:18345 length:744 start_codon:yes stop_codon:yes gene_type:complete
MSYNIALLIPTTSKDRPEWNTIKDAYLINYTLKTFLLTYNKEHNYTFYIGYDNDDRIYSDIKQHEQIYRYTKVFKNINFKFIKFNIEKGFLTQMWNFLFREAYNDNNDYYYQCGDDIKFKTKNWINDSINVLRKNNNIGISGPVNNNDAGILTQVMVSKKHMEIFGYFFIEDVKNWCCDDWINEVYKPNNIFHLRDHYCDNCSVIDKPHQYRYDIDNDPNFFYKRGELGKLRMLVINIANSQKHLIK